MNDDYDYLPFTFMLTFLSISIILVLNPHSLDAALSLVLIFLPLAIPTLFPLLAIFLVKRHRHSAHVFLYSSLVCYPTYIYLCNSTHINDLSGKLFNFAWTTPDLWHFSFDTLAKLLHHLMTQGAFIRHHI